MAPRPASGVLLTMLLLLFTLAVLPIDPATGASGHPTLGVTNTDVSQPTSFSAATVSVNVTAGSDLGVTDGSVGGFFAIDFGAFGGAQLVTFSGAQFSLYLSQDGFSQISPGDIRYAGPTLFSVADLTINPGWRSVVQTNGTFYIGQTTGGQEVLTGPLPIKVGDSYKHIKVFDGSTASVAVGGQSVVILPGLTLTPNSGSAGVPVNLVGGGFPSNTVVELAYSFVFNPWTGSPTTQVGNLTSPMNTGRGYFNVTVPMIDTKQAYNPNGGVQATSSITISAKHQASPHTTYASAIYDEGTRVLTEVKSFSSAGALIDFNNAPPGPYGNDTSSAGSNLIQPVQADVQGTLKIAGSNMMANSQVSFWIGGALVGSTNTNGSGRFNATAVVPILPAGNAEAQVVNDGVTYDFTVQILPTLLLTPSSGPVGTHVLVQAYGFPANGAFFIYWFGHSFGDLTWYQVAHGTTGSTGTFNVTVEFNVPQAYGGSHSVAASSTNATTSSPNPPPSTQALAGFAIGSSGTTTTTTTITSTRSTTIFTQSTTQTNTITQPTTQTVTTVQPTTIIQPTTTTQTSLQTTISMSSPSDSTYFVLGAVAVVVAAASGAFAWILRGRRA